MDLKSALGHLREAAQRMVEEFPCKETNPVKFMKCHCATCEMKHALSATGGLDVPGSERTNLPIEP